jgi:anaerobic selenocysteine-containing dehydrogenase
MSPLMSRPRWPKDNGMEISEIEWDTAVSYLVQGLSLERWAEIQEAIGARGRRWYAGEGQHLGREVRQLLVRGGFRWGAVCMQANWFKLVEEGARRVYFVRVEMTG